MKTQHTAGRWTVVDSGGTVISAREVTYITICKLENLPLRISPEVEANAKLIAAAPDMLEALIEAKRMYEEVQPCGGWQGVYEQIESAIKKATE
jgi:hypothetical protein